MRESSIERLSGRLGLSGGPHNREQYRLECWCRGSAMRRGKCPGGGVARPSPRAICPLDTTMGCLPLRTLKPSVSACARVRVRVRACVCAYACACVPACLRACVSRCVLCADITSVEAMPSYQHYPLLRVTAVITALHFTLPSDDLPNLQVPTCR